MQLTIAYSHTSHTSLHGINMAKRYTRDEALLLLFDDDVDDGPQSEEEDVSEEDDDTEFHADEDSNSEEKMEEEEGFTNAGTSFPSKNANIIWHPSTTVTPSRATSENIIHKRPGPTRYAIARTDEILSDVFSDVFNSYTVIVIILSFQLQNVLFYCESKFFFIFECTVEQLYMYVML